MTGFSETAVPTRFCNPFATCREGDANRCRCDSSCILYNDCCIDVYRVNAKLDSSANVKFSCLQLVPSQSFYAVDRCSNSLIDSAAVRKRCEIWEDLTDPLMSIPATDIQRGITYRNRYCAECNGANSEDLSSWFVVLTCNSLLHYQHLYHNITQDFVVHNIIRVGNTWGVYHWNQSGHSTSFFRCDISFSLPPHLLPYLRSCDMNMVSECALDWDDEKTRKWCEFYMSAVFDVNGEIYRNVDCATCNYVPISNIKCYVEGGYEQDVPGVLGIKPPTLNFAILLDVNPNDGNIVGLKSHCPSDQVFDPFMKKCRSLVCAVPGFVRKNNKCIQQ